MSGGQDGAPASAPPKPRLKINVNRSSSFAGAGNDNATATPSQTPATATPGGDGTMRKVKLKITPSQPPTPAESTPIKTKAGRQPKPTQKLVDSKKRPAEDDDDDDEDAPLSQSHPARKIKLKHTTRAGPKSAATQLTLKSKGKPPYHPPGDGYDSEASDREIDPAIEEQLILRLPPGEHADYVKQMMETGKIGIPRSQGGADFHFKFFDEDSRRAYVQIKGQPFAAVMVDLPTITEAMKTWDRKSLMKSADICQMLLVFQKVRNEEEAKKAPLPSILDNHFKWPHGLTPPMHDCVNRRFAKTISRKEIEDKEAEVERLLAEDAKARSTRWEWVDEREQDEDDEEPDDSSAGEEVEEDAEGEVDETMDYFGEADDYGDLEDAMEAAFADAADDSMVTDTPAAGTEAATPMTATQMDTPGGAVQDSIEADESEEDGSDDDDDDDDDDLDDDERAQRDEEQGIKDIIADMQKQLAAKQRELAGQQNRILKQRIENQIRELKSEIELKMSSIGMEADE